MTNRDMQLGIRLQRDPATREPLGYTVGGAGLILYRTLTRARKVARLLYGFDETAQKRGYGREVGRR